MSVNTAAFMRAFDASVANVQDEFNERLAAAALQLFGSIVEKTPVDTGMLRGAWQVTLGSPSAQDILTSSDANSRARAVLNGYSGGSIYFTNNMPYAYTAEYGGWGRGAGATNKTTADGYSVQAPNGMVRISLSEFTDALNAGG